MPETKWNKLVDNLATIIKLRKPDVSHESVAAAIGKERSVLTKKLGGRVPLTVEEFFRIIEFLHIDATSLFLARTDLDLVMIAKKGKLDIKEPAREVSQFMSALKGRYQQSLPEDKRAVLDYLISELQKLFNEIET